MLRSRIHGSTLRVTLLAVGLALGASRGLEAQGESAVRGLVRDLSRMAPIAGAQVVLAPGARGAVTDAGGRFFIPDVRPGVYRIVVRALGYAPVERRGVRIIGNRVLELTFGMQPEPVPLEGIVVEARPDPFLDPTVTATVQAIDGDELRQLPVTTLDEAVALQSGVVAGSFRGGRVGEDALIVDGLAVKNQLDASTGLLGVSLPPAAIQEATVITNGFSARYGQALSGMVSVVTRDGGDRLEGSLVYETDRPLPDGADVGLDRLEATVGFPVGAMRFLAVLDARARIDDDPVNAPAPTDPLDPRFARPWLLPHNSGEHFDLLAKVTVPIGGRATLRVLGLGSERRRLLYDPVLKYAPAQGPAESARGRLLQTHLRRSSRPDSASATIVDLRLGYFEKEALRAPLLAEPARRFGGFSFGGLALAGGDLAAAQDSIGALAPIPGFDVPEFASGTPWGVPAFFQTSSPRGELAWNRFREGRVRLDLFVGRGPDMDVRAGGEFVGQQVRTFTRLEAYRAVADGAPAPRRASFSPLAASAYTELTRRMSDLTLSVGLRADLFDARAVSRETALGGVQFALGPRVAVSTSLSAATVTASFGRFVQPPDFQYLVDAAFDDTLRTGRFRRGNPGLGFETSTQYELQVRVRTSAAGSVRLGAFVKRLDGLITSIPVGFDPDSAVFGNGDFGTVRGVELRLERDFLGGVGARLSYTLQDAQATASDAFDFFRRLRLSPLGDTIMPGVVSFPLDYDRRHAVVALVRGRAPLDLGPIARGWEASVVARYGSGLPFTRTNLTGDSIVGLPNGGRLPSEFQVDFRLARRLPLGSLELAFYLDVRNLTNRRNVVAVRRDTGSPAPGAVQVDAMAEAAFLANPDPIPYESPGYRREADLDGNGLIAGREELVPLYVRAARDFLQPLFAYGPPRLVRLGMRVAW